MLNNLVIKFAIFKAFITLKALNRFEKALRELITFVIQVNINIILRSFSTFTINIKTFVIDYRFTYINVKTLINFTLMNIKNYYDNYY